MPQRAFASAQLVDDLAELVNAVAVMALGQHVAENQIPVQPPLLLEVSQDTEGPVLTEPSAPPVVALEVDPVQGLGDFLGAVIGRRSAGDEVQCTHLDPQPRRGLETDSTTASDDPRAWRAASSKVW